MLDVARHFVPVAGVKRHIELAGRYKLNILHLHLTDDQGWRIHVDRWPRLTQHGGSLQVGGTVGGHYTKDEYLEIVRHAAEHYMTVVPEIDIPGHTHAALASYPELNPDGRSRPLYTGTDVGISSLCIGNDVTDRFVEDVLSEIAELTPGPFLHIGGDEAAHTSPEDYIAFIERVNEIVLAQGKTVVGWEEVAKAELAVGSIVQFWNNGSGRPSGPELARSAVERGLKLVMSPSDRAYLDMKYDSTTELGTQWAGFVDVRRAYDWDPSRHIAEVDESDIAGIEAPIWTETIADLDSLDFMVWPRLAGIAELGWSSAGRSWDEYRMRLAAHGPRWQAAGVNFFRSPQVPWEQSW
jgi:hexosaminidase